LVLAGSTVFLAVVSALALRGGVSYLNIDNLRAHPLAFTLLFVVAPALALLSLLLAAVPRLIQINLLMFLGFWLCTEMIFWFMRSRIPQLHGDPVGVNQQYYLHDPVLGYRPAPNSIARHTEFLGDKQVYSVTYYIDQFGRRETPVNAPTSRHRFLLFLGDSNTFGEGVTQHETLPLWAGEFAPDYYPYNYAFSGWAPPRSSIC
jgi:hypothetical protein